MTCSKIGQAFLTTLVERMPTGSELNNKMAPKEEKRNGRRHCYCYLS